MSEATIDEADIEDDNGPPTQPSIPPLPSTQPGPHAFSELAGRVTHLETKTDATDGRVTKVEDRLDSGEGRFELIESQVEKLLEKTDAQTLLLTRIDTGLSALLKTRIGRAILIGLGLVILGWLAKHGIHLNWEVPK